MSPRPDREILSNVRDILHALETRPHAALDDKAAQSVGRYFRRWIAELEDAIARQTESQPTS